MKRFLTSFLHFAPDNGSGMHRLWTDNGPMKSRKLFALLFTLLFVGVGNAWADEYERVTDLSQLSDGDQVILVKSAANNTSSYAMSTTQNTNNRGMTSVSISSSGIITLTGSHTVQILTLKINASGKYGFHTGSGYLQKSGTSSNNYLITNSTAASTAPSSNYAWTPSLTASGNYPVSLQNVGATSFYLQFNGTTYVSSYKNTQTDPCIFKKKTASGYTLTFKETGGSNNGSGLAAANATSMTISTAPTPATGKMVEGYYAENTLTTKVANADGSWAANNIAGWVTSGKYTKGSAANLYIKWTDLVTTVTLDKGTDGTTDGTATITYNATSFTSITDATKTGYHLSGYYTTAGGGSKVINADGSLVASQSGWTSMGKWIKEATEATLYAHWTIDDYTVSWSVNGESWTTGVSSSNNHANYKSKITSMPTDPTSSNCDNSKVFVGWTKSSSYSSATTPPSDLFTTVAGSPTITGNTTFYAVFATADANVTAKDTWKKISSTSQITDGMQVLLINKNSTTYYAINSSAGATSITGVGSATFTTNNNALRFAVEKGVSNYKFKTLDGKYLSTSAQSNNTTLQLDKTYDTWTISSDAGSETGTFNLVNSIALEYYSSTLKLYGWSDSYKQYFRFVICIPAYTNYATSCCTPLGSINGSFW